MNSKKSLCKIPTNLLLKYQNPIPFDIHIRLSSEKTIKISHKHSEDLQAVLKKYLDKGVISVYMHEADYATFIKSYREKFRQQIAGKFFDPASKPLDVLVILNETFLLAKESFMQIGVSDELLEMTVEISKNSLRMVQNSSNIYTFFMEFKDRCEAEFINSLLVSFTISCMIDTFPWDSITIKEKASMAAMLCDITLHPEDFKELAENIESPSQLSDKVFRHPEDITKMLSNRNKYISWETLVIIEQHHETPQYGFPKKLRSNTINLLSAIYMVANHFIKRLTEHNFAFDQRSNILTEITRTYAQGNFRKAAQSLIKVVGDIKKTV